MGKGKTRSKKSSNKPPKWVKKDNSKTPELKKQAFYITWHRFKESLLLAIVKACFLITALIYIVFLIKPRQAHILVNLSEISERTSLEANNVVLNYPDCDEIRFFSNEAVYIKLKDCEVEEVSSDVNRESFWLVIYPNDNETNSKSHFSATGKVSSVSLSNTSSINMYDYSFEKSVCKFDGSVNLFISVGRAVFETRDGKAVAEPDVFSYTIIKKKTTAENTNTPSETEELNVMEFANSFSKEEYAHQHERSITSIIDYSSGELLASGIKHFESNATGKLRISYTPTPQEYSLYKQELILNNDTNLENLELEYNVKHNADAVYESEGVLYGFVTDGEFSKMSLFPSFKTWFYSNAYMTPTAIIAVVLTAIGIFNKKDKGVKPS